MASGQLSGFIFKDSTVFFGVILFVPAVLVYTKTLRMRSKDAFEETVMLRYKSEFWQRGSEFSRAMRERMFDDIIFKRREELDEAARMEEKGLTTSSLEGAQYVCDLLDNKKFLEEQKLEMQQQQQETNSVSANKSGGIFGGWFG